MHPPPQTGCAAKTSGRAKAKQSWQLRGEKGHSPSLAAGAQRGLLSEGTPHRCVLSPLGGGKVGRGSPLMFKHTKTNNRRRRKKKLKLSENASLFPRRVIKAFWQSEVVFILVLCCVAALTPSAVGAVRRRT